MSVVRFDTTVGTTLDKLHDLKLTPVQAIPTPFPSWNALCGEEGGGKGLAKRWLIIIGGVTGTGKSYLGLNLAARAVLEGQLVGMLNFEMTQMAVTTRFLSIISGLPKWRMEWGDNFSSPTWKEAQAKVNQVYEEVGGAFVTNESTVFSINHVENSYKTLADAGATMVVLDYAQLVTVPGASGIYQRSEEVATRLRELTHEYNMTTVAISQFNREEARMNKPPSIHGLMGGGIWEQASNQIWLLNHTLRKRYGKKPNGLMSGEYTEILCGKNRHGIAPFEMPVKWNYSSMRFEEYTPGTDDNDPFFDSQIDGVELRTPEVKEEEPPEDYVPEDLF
jgi:replicative DNA helicase